VSSGRSSSRRQARTRRLASTPVTRRTTTPSCDQRDVPSGHQAHPEPGGEGLDRLLGGGDLRADHGRAATAGVEGEPEVAQRPARRGQGEERLVEQLQEGDLVTASEPVGGGQRDEPRLTGHLDPAVPRRVGQGQPDEGGVRAVAARGGEAGGGVVPADLPHAQPRARRALGEPGPHGRQQAAPQPRGDPDDHGGALGGAGGGEPASASDQADRTARAFGSNAAPAGVSSTVRRSRTNRGTRSCPSSARICLDSAGWLTNSASAAFVKCRCSATATKYRRSRTCTSMPIGYHSGSWTATARTGEGGSSRREERPEETRDDQ
jgi:hypothetical protein